MATLIILIGAAVAVLILGGALLIVLASTREKTGRGRRLPGFSRIASPDSEEPVDPPG
jgi:hypothetical protein